MNNITLEGLAVDLANLKKQVDTISKRTGERDGKNEAELSNVSIKTDTLKNETESAISDAWSPKILYEAESYVLDDNRVWLAKLRNIGQKPAESPVYWENVNLVSELNKLSNEIKKIKESE